MYLKTNDAIWNRNWENISLRAIKILNALILLWFNITNLFIMRTLDKQGSSLV